MYFVDIALTQITICIPFNLIFFDFPALPFKPLFFAPLTIDNTSLSSMSFASTVEVHIL